MEAVVDVANGRRHAVDQARRLGHQFAEAALLGAGLQKGAAVVFVSGTPVGVPGRTDALHIRHLGA